MDCLTKTGNLNDAASVFEQFVNPTTFGDYSGNGSVDAADFIVWRKTGGSPDEYNTWRANFGHTFLTGSGPLANHVPEPSTAMLLILAAVGFRPGRHRRAPQVSKLINA